MKLKAELLTEWQRTHIIIHDLIFIFRYLNTVHDLLMNAELSVNYFLFISWLVLTLIHFTYKSSDSKFNTPRTSRILTSPQIRPHENKVPYSNLYIWQWKYFTFVPDAESRTQIEEVHSWGYRSQVTIWVWSLTCLGPRIHLKLCVIQPSVDLSW